MNETKIPENRAYKVTLILLLGLAAFSTAMKELNEMRAMVSSVREFARQLPRADLVAVNEQPLSTEEVCLRGRPYLSDSFTEYGSRESIAPDRVLEITPIELEHFTEPDLDAKIEMISRPTPNHKSSPLVRAKVAPVKNLKQEISWSYRDGDWPGRFEYKTLDRTVTLKVPMTMVADLDADDFEHEVSPRLLSGLLSKIDRKSGHGRGEIRRRELLIKRFERSISSRRAS